MSKKSLKMIYQKYSELSVFFLCTFSSLLATRQNESGKCFLLRSGGNIRGKKGKNSKQMIFCEGLSKVVYHNFGLLLSFIIMPVYMDGIMQTRK